MASQASTVKNLSIIRKKYSINDIEAIAAWLWTNIKNSRVIALHGEMGLGKTTLVTAVCKHLLVKETVSSPTFSIINEYSFDGENGAEQTIYHIDLYRLKNEQEVISTGVEDCLFSDAYCFVEWPERAERLLPNDAVHVYFHAENENARTIEIDKN